MAGSDSFHGAPELVCYYVKGKCVTLRITANLRSQECGPSAKANCSHKEDAA